MASAPRIAAIVPCYNEEAAVGKVVCDLKRAVPDITVYVYDNNSTDRTAAVAAEAGAIVRTERRRGKGNVVRRAFADIDADIYVLIDGDDTYDAAAAPAMIARSTEVPSTTCSASGGQPRNGAPTALVTKPATAVQSPGRIPVRRGGDGHAQRLPRVLAADS